MSFSDTDCETTSDKFAEFDKSSCRLDEFYCDKVLFQKYSELLFVLRVILTGSHRKASVDGGFSINNAALETKMHPETVLSKRILKDHFIAKSLHLTLSEWKSQ